MDFAEISDQLGTDMLLLLPQRKYRDILRRARTGAALTLDMLSAEDEEGEITTDYSDFIEQNRGSYTIHEGPDRDVSKLEKTLAAQNKFIKLICEYLTIKGVGALHGTCRVIKDMYDLYVAEVRLSLVDFNRFVKYKLTPSRVPHGSVVGLLSNKSLSCGQRGEVLSERSCQRLTLFFNSDRMDVYSLSMKSVCLSLDLILDSIMLMNFFTSLGGVGDHLQTLNLEGSIIWLSP